MAVIKLLHLNMRKTNSHNFGSGNNSVQPEDIDYFKNVTVGFRNQQKPTYQQYSQKVLDNKFSFLNAGNSSKTEKQIDFGPQSPRVRDFLRHTTYVSKPEGQVEKKKSQMYSSGMGKYFTKKNNTPNSDAGKYSNQSSPVYSTGMKTYVNEKNEKIPTKIHTTASFIQELKKMKQQKNKTVENSSYSKITSETEKMAESASSNFVFDNGLKKKMDQDFYTPKPESNAAQKTKRGYTPNVVPKKVISPSHRKGVRIQDFILQTKLGGGKFGTVYKAYHIKTRSLYALKKIPKNMLKEHMMVDQFLLEVKLQTFLKHKNILQIYGVFDDKENVYLILQFMEEGTLYSELKKKKKLSQQEAAIKIKQIANAVVYMHDNKIVHRDIKPENIVMSGGICKLCDFGWATICDDRRKTYCGTIDYSAPEILEGSQYDFSVDLWCLGVLAYQLMVGKAPFYHVSRKETIDNILNVQKKKITYPETMSPVAVSFINCLLKKKPEQRLNNSEILDHPFIKEIVQQF